MTSTMTLDMIASRDRAVRILQSSIFINDGATLEGGWSVNFPNQDFPERHVFSCRGDHAGVEITIDHPRADEREESNGTSFLVKIYVPKHDYIVLEGTEIYSPTFFRSGKAFLDHIDDRANADLIQTALAKGVAIARAPYGLAALFAARFEQQRKADLAAQQEDAARRETIAKARERLSAELFALGVEGIALDHCVTGFWYDAQAMWCWNGAVVAFVPTNSEFFVYVQPVSSPKIEGWRLVGSVVKNLRSPESSEKTAADFLDLITTAQQLYRESKPKPSPLIDDDDEDESLPLLPLYAVGYFEQGSREVEFWIDARVEQGYRNPVFAPTIGGWVYVTMRLEE